MTAGRYSLLDHTADLGFEIYGRDLRELFANACFALFDNITDLSRIVGDSSQVLTVKGDDRSDLLVNWLRELLGLWAVENLLIKEARVLNISKKELTAKLFFDHYTTGRHLLKTDIKAVTYHNAEIRQQNNGWTARIVVDV